MSGVAPVLRRAVVPVATRGMVLAAFAPSMNHGAAQEAVRSNFTGAPPNIDGNIGEEDSKAMSTERRDAWC